MREVAFHHRLQESQTRSEKATSILFVPSVMQSTNNSPLLALHRGCEPSGFCFFGRGSDSGDALKNRALPPSLLCIVSLPLLPSQTHRLILSRLYLAIGGLSLNPYPPDTPLQDILLSSCTLTVSDYIQSTICKAFSVFCFVSSFLSAFASSSRNLGKKKKKPSIGFQSVLPGEDLLLLLFFLASFPSSFCTCSCTCITPIQKITGSPLHLISLSLLFSFCSFPPYALQFRALCV